MSSTIMVINHEKEILNLFRDILTDEGYQVVLSPLWTCTLGEVEQVNPNLIIIDHLFFGETRGWQFLQALKLSRTTAMTPIIVCTAVTKEVREIESDLEAKNICLLPKPFDIDDLLQAINLSLPLAR
ncbi:MAG: response regulator [Ardenticatenales bacterium]|nr:response regulator [Ardenticatenales bacterium]